MRARLRRSHCRGKRHLKNFKTLREVVIKLGVVIKVEVVIKLEVVTKLGGCRSYILGMRDLFYTLASRNQKEMLFCAS